MNKLLTVDQWEERYKEFCKIHFWLRYQKNFALAPGWLNLIHDCLIDLEKILSLNELEYILFFGLGNERNLYANFDPAIGKVKAAQCKTIIKRCIYMSSDICYKCGAELDAGNRLWAGDVTARTCDEHAGFDGVFSDEWDADQIRSICKLGGFNQDDDEDRPENMADEEHAHADDDAAVMNEETPAVEQPRQKRPSAKLYSMSDVDLMLDDKNNDRQINRKRKDMAEKMEWMGEMRDFCLVPDSNEMAQALRLLFPNFSEVIDFIETYVALAGITGKLRLPPILLEGVPGIGKTAFTSALAKWLRTGYLEIHMENEQTNSTLAGSSEFWGNSQCGALFETLVFGETCNPLVVVDEIDKAMKTHQYNPIAPLYQLLERETSRKFRDLGCRAVALDASHVLWIMTANDVSQIDVPIMSRLRNFKIPEPTQEQSEGIAQRIYSNVLARNEWTEFFDEALSAQATHKLAKFSPRRMQAEIEAALGKVAKMGRRTVLASDIGDSGHVPKPFGFLP